MPKFEKPSNCLLRLFRKHKEECKKIKSPTRPKKKTNSFIFCSQGRYKFYFAMIFEQKRDDEMQMALQLPLHTTPPQSPGHSSVGMRYRKDLIRSTFSSYCSIPPAENQPSDQRAPPSISRFKVFLLIYVSIRCTPGPGNPSYYEAEAGGSQRLQSEFKASLNNLKVRPYPSLILYFKQWVWPGCGVTYL